MEMMPEERVTGLGQSCSTHSSTLSRESSHGNREGTKASNIWVLARKLV